MPKTQCTGHRLGYPGIAEGASCDSAIEVLLDLPGTVLGDKYLMFGQQLRSHALRCLYYPPPLDNLLENPQGQGIREVECHEIKSGFLFPMRKTAALPNPHLAETRLYRTLNDAFGRIGPGDCWHKGTFYAWSSICAGRDALTTAGQEAGATRGVLPVSPYRSSGSYGPASRLRLHVFGNLLPLAGV